MNPFRDPGERPFYPRDPNEDAPQRVRVLEVVPDPFPQRTYANAFERFTVDSNGSIREQLPREDLTDNRSSVEPGHPPHRRVA